MRPGLVLVWMLASCGGRSQLLGTHPPAVVHDASTPDAGLRALTIAAGGSTACARISDGQPRCWGANGSGQLGDGTTRDRPRPVPTLLPDGAAVIAVGGAHTCGQAPGGGVFCWGANAFGQLGDGTTTPHAVPVRIDAGDVLAFALGPSHSMVLVRGGTVQTFGNDDHCELGTSMRAPFDSHPAPLPDPLDGPGTATAIAAGGTFSCEVFDDGRLRCSGALSPDGAEWCPPNEVGALEPVAAVTVGQGHLCALGRTGSVFCRGGNESGQLGDGTTTSRDAWAPARLPGPALAIVAGAQSTCAILANGTLHCWGTLGPATYGPMATQVAVVGVPQAIAVGSDFACVLATDGSVSCWGGNAHGQLGDGTTIARVTPAIVTF